MVKKQRRRFPRIASHHAVLVTRLGEDPAEHIARTNTMGLGGCGFVSSEHLEPGERLEILIAVRHKVVKAEARVVYSSACGDGTSEIGVEFLAMSASDRKIIERLFEKPEKKAQKAAAASV